MKTLAEMFPNLAWAHDTDAFIEHADKIPLVSQFENRRVRHIEIRPLLCTAGLDIKDNDFVLVFNDVADTDEKVESCGHEIGHTFHFDIHGQCPVHSIPSLTHPNNLKLFREIEKFCDAFSEHWYKKINLEELRKLVVLSRIF